MKRSKNKQVNTTIQMQPFTARLLLLALLLFPGLRAVAQSGTAADCKHPASEADYAFADSEELTYLANYTWGLISSDVGEATLKINRLVNANTPFFFVEATAKTYKFYDSFFKVRDTYMARFNAETMKPAYFHRNISEGNYAKRNTFNFDWDAMQLKSTTQRKTNPPKDTLLPLTPCTFDVLTLLYYSRNLDFSFIEAGQTFPLTFAIDEAVYNIKYRFVQRETVELKGLGNFRCLKFAVEVIAGDVFTGKDEVSMWITDDKNHIPIKIESPITVGTVKAVLVKMKNTKHPLTSKN